MRFCVCVFYRVQNWKKGNEDNNDNRTMVFKIKKIWGRATGEKNTITYRHKGLPACIVLHS
jgi:hypothetical protein